MGRHIPVLLFVGSVALCATSPANANAEILQKLGSSQMIRVHLVETTSPIVRPKGSWRVYHGEAGQITPLVSNKEYPVSMLRRDGRISTSSLSKEASVTLKPLSDDATLTLNPSAEKANTYQGVIEFHEIKDQVYDVIATVPLEEYLRGVVPSEIGAEAPDQSKCAQAIAARSYAVLTVLGNKHEGSNYHICSTVHCQVYSGVTRATASTDAAVSATKGLILTHNNKPIAAYYASCCAGHSEDIRNIWPERTGNGAYNNSHFDAPKNLPLDLTDHAVFHDWITSSPFSYCNPKTAEVLGWAGRNFRWTREFEAEDVSRFAAEKKDIGRVVAIRQGKRGTSGRLVDMELIGDKGSLKVEGQMDIRKLFKPALRSSAVSVTTSGPVEKPSHFIFHGGGSGHGVGMCQTGAMGMANSGKNFREILNHYYPTLKIKKIY